MSDILELAHKVTEQEQELVRARERIEELTAQLAESIESSEPATDEQVKQYTAKLLIKAGQREDAGFTTKELSRMLGWTGDHTERTEELLRVGAYFTYYIDHTILSIHQRLLNKIDKRLTQQEETISDMVSEILTEYEETRQPNIKPPEELGIIQVLPRFTRAYKKALENPEMHLEAYIDMIDVELEIIKERS